MKNRIFFNSIFNIYSADACLKLSIYSSQLIFVSSKRGCVVKQWEIFNKIKARKKIAAPLLRNRQYFVNNRGFAA